MDENSVAQTEADEPDAAPAAEHAFICAMWGYIFLLVGAVLVFLAFTHQTTAEYSTTLNMGLLQDQMMKLHTGLTASLAGVLLLAFSQVLKMLERR